MIRAINTILMLIVFVLAGFLFDVVRTEYVFPGVSLSGERVSRMSHEALRETMDTFEGYVFEEEIVLVVGDTEYSTTLDEVGISLDKNDALQRVQYFGHNETLVKSFSLWVASFFRPHEISLDDDIVFDQQILLGFLEDDADIKPPFEGDMRIQGEGIFAIPPQDGYGVDYTQLGLVVSDAITRQASEPTISLSLSVLSPEMSVQEFEKFRKSISSYVNEGITVSHKGNVVLERTDQALLDLTVIEKNDNGWYLRIPSKNEDDFFGDLLARNAEFFVTEDYIVEIIPSETGFLFDREQLKSNLHYAFDRGIHKLSLTTSGDTEPEIITEDLEEMEIKHVISQFTTYFDCCQSRVTNIRRIAEIIDGVIVQPGESFELNEYVGQRTIKKGFVPAGALMFGEHVEDVGGGISQFATTTYNAIYWGALWIETHKPHSQYFSRYPEGIEATVSWKYPTLRFTNDYQTPVIIRASSTDTSVTVSILGDNNGRIMIGDHRRGTTNMEAVAVGGDTSRIVTSTVSGRYDFLPAPIKHIAYPSRYAPGGNQIVEIGKTGWTTNVTRTVEYPGVAPSFTQNWKVKYTHPTIVQVYSCAEVTEPGASCVTAE